MDWKALARPLLPERRIRFRDISRPGAARTPASDVIQFYSSVPNIGNLTPVLGIQQATGLATDTWCIHRTPVDFDFINRHYKCAIIGGAGLLFRPFSPFWKEVAERCRIPMIIWGVGACMPDSAPGALADPEAVARVMERCDLVNLRDDLTAERYGAPHAEIAPCPTVLWLQAMRTGRTPRGPVLFSSHEELVVPAETARIHGQLRSRAAGYLYTSNIQTRWVGIPQIIERRYLRSSAVVTTRLHGAIIAYGLDIPYVALARDHKLRAFGRLYGGGQVVEDVEEIGGALSNLASTGDNDRGRESAEQFAAKAIGWLGEQGVSLDGVRPSTPPAMALPSARSGGSAREAGA